MPVPDFATLAPVREVPDFGSLKLYRTPTSPSHDEQQDGEEFVPTRAVQPLVSPPHTEESDVPPTPPERPQIKLSPYEQADVASMGAGRGKALTGMESGTEFTQALFQQLPEDVATLSRAAVADVAAGMAMDPEASGNIPAALKREPLPIDRIMREAALDAKETGRPPTSATIAHISQDLAATAPLMAGMAGLPAGIGKAVLYGFTAKMIADAPEVATQLGDELGKPKSEQDPDKIAALFGQAVQITGFSVLGAKVGGKELSRPIEAKFAPAKFLARELAASPLEVKADQIAPFAPLTAQAVKEVAQTEKPVTAEELAKFKADAAAEVPTVAVETKPVPETEPKTAANKINSGIIEDAINDFLKENDLHPNTFDNDQRVEIHNMVRAALQNFPVSKGLIKAGLGMDPFLPFMKKMGLLPQDWEPVSQRTKPGFESGLRRETAEEQADKTKREQERLFGGGTIEQARDYLAEREASLTGKRTDAAMRDFVRARIAAKAPIRKDDWQIVINDEDLRSLAESVGYEPTKDGHWFYPVGLSPIIGSVQQPTKEKGKEYALEPETAQPVRTVRNEPEQGPGEVPAEGSSTPDDEGRGKAPPAEVPKEVAPEKDKLTLLREEGITQSNAEAILSGEKTPKEIVDSQIGLPDTGPERHTEARLLAKTTAINRINEILGKPERYTADELYGKKAREKELAETENFYGPELTKPPEPSAQEPTPPSQPRTEGGTAPVETGVPVEVQPKPSESVSSGAAAPEPPAGPAPTRLEQNKYGANPVWLKELTKPENADITELWKRYQESNDPNARQLLTGGTRGLLLRIKDIREMMRDYPSLLKTAPPEPPKAPEVAQEPKGEAAQSEITPGMSENQKSQILGGQVRDKILNAPSFPKLLAAAKSFKKSLHGKLSENWEAIVTKEPWDLLSTHSGVMNARSARAKTLKSLADAVIKEAGLPMKESGRYRGMDYRIDWNKLAEQTKTEAPAPAPKPGTEAGAVERGPQTEVRFSITTESGEHNATAIIPKDMMPNRLGVHVARTLQKTEAGDYIVKGGWSTTKAGAEEKLINSLAAKHADISGADYASHQQNMAAHEAAAEPIRTAIGEQIKQRRTELLNQAITDRQASGHPAIWIDDQVITESGKYTVKDNGLLSKVQDLSVKGFEKNLTDILGSEGEGRWWGANDAAKKRMGEIEKARTEKAKTEAEVKAKEEAKAAEQQKNRSDYEKEVEATELPKGKKENVTVPVKIEGKESTQQHEMTVYGNWAIRKNTSGSEKSGYKYFITHVPTGLSLGGDMKIGTLKEAQNIIKAVIHSGVDASKKTFTNEETKKLFESRNAYAVDTSKAPDWWLNRPKPEPVKPPTVPTITNEPKVSDEVRWTTGAGDKARSTVQRIDKYPNDPEPMATVDWFGTKRVPVSQLELVKKSSRRIAEEERIAKLQPAPEPAPPAPAQETGPEIGIGPGGRTARPSAKPEAPEAYEGTSLKNAVADLERAGLGLKEASPIQHRNMAEAWINSEGKEAEGRILAEQIISNPERGITDAESALLLRHKVGLFNALNDAAERTITGTEESKAGARIQYAQLSDQFNTLLDAIKERGSEWGREGRWRQAMAYEDYSFAAQERLLRAAKGGEPLTDAERTKLLNDIAEHKQRVAELESHLLTREARIAELETKAALDRIALEAKAEPLYHPSILSAAERVVKGFEKRADAAANRLREKLSRVSVGLDPTIVLDLAEIGVAKLGRKIVDFAKWADAVRQHVGEKFATQIEPYLKEAFEQSKAMLESDLLKVKGPSAAKVKEAVKGTATADAKADLAGKIKTKLEGKKLDEITSLVQKLARYFVGEGVKGRDALIDAVHGVLTQIDPSITRRDAMDAISGYGSYKRLTKDAISVQLREYKGEMQQVAKLEDMAAGEAPLKTGIERRTPSDEERRLIQLVNEEKKKGNYSVNDPETQLASAQMSRLTYYRNRIADISDELAKKQQLVKERKIPPTSPEIEALKAEYERLRAQRAEVFNTALAGFKKRTAKRIADMEEKISTENFDPRPRKPQPALDAEAKDLVAAKARVEQRLADARRSAELRQRSMPRKIWDFFSRWLRREMVLSSPVSLAKLTAAAGEGLTLEPAKETVGMGVAKAFPEFSKRLTVEAPSSIRIEAKTLRDAFMESMKDSVQTLKTGKSDLEMAFGGRKAVPEEMISYFGRLHAALKTPLKRAAFSRVFEKLARDSMERSGDTILDPMEQMRIGNLAMREANRMLFLEDNKLVSAYQRWLSAFEEKVKDTGKPSTLGVFSAGLMRMTLPIVRIPTNLVARTIQAAVGLPVGGAKLAMAYAKGIQNLPPAEADLIMRQIKQGSIGAGIMLLGFFNPDLFGGYYQEGEKRKADDVAVGKMRTPIGDIPAYLLHHPLLQVAQLGATMRRVADSKLRKKDTEPQGLATGIVAGLLGLIEEVPFSREMIDLAKLRSPHERTAFIGEYLKSLTVPQGVQWTAKQMDKPVPFSPFEETIKRKTETIPEHIQSGIPGLREELPVKTK